MANESDRVEAAPIPHRGFTSRALAKAIFAADAPEEFIRSIPAQGLYMAVQHNGLDSSVDLIELASHEQVRLLLDFDLWSEDHLDEERIWSWLRLSDEEHGLRILQKVIRSIDLKIVSLLVSRHTDIRVFTEPTEQPPGPGYHTPDKGSTWIGITTEDADKHFLLARLLALIFETDAELFYQLLAIPGVSTESVLEEESLQDRQRRLSADGVPDRDLAHAICAPLTDVDFTAALLSGPPRRHVHDIEAIHPLLYDVPTLQPLGGLISSLGRFDEFEAELTLIMNAAVVTFHVPFHNPDAVHLLAAQVKGAINIGLEIAAREGRSPAAVYEQLGLQPIFRLGLGRILALRRLAQRRERTAPAGDEAVAIIVEGLTGRFPTMPLFVQPDGTIHAAEGRLERSFRAIEHLGDITVLKRRVE